MLYKLIFALIVLLVNLITIIFRALSPNLRRLKKNIPLRLNKYSTYYQNLNKKEQTNFEKRVYDFIALKKFYRLEKNSKVSDEMKILIAASAVQITFGYPIACAFEVFRKIAISDKEYISTQTKRLHQGETNPRKSLVAFSWRHFMEGVKYPNDSINLGIHEFSHALFINNVRGYRNQDFKAMMNDWHKEAGKIMQTPAARDFFRSYGFVNKMEFFAVSMEVFFENPKTFQERFPELYAIMCMQLNQNPQLPNNGIARKRRFAYSR